MHGESDNLSKPRVEICKDAPKDPKSKNDDSPNTNIRQSYIDYITNIKKTQNAITLRRRYRIERFSKPTDLPAKLGIDEEETGQ